MGFQKYIGYALIDPRDFRIFYIGVTKNLKHRKSCHKSRAMRGSKTKRHCTIREIWKESLDFILKPLVSKPTLSEILDWENKTILGIGLDHLDNGNTGGCYPIVTQEFRDLMSKILKGKKRKPLSLEHRRYISKLHLGKKKGPQSSEHLAKMSKIRKGKKHSEITKLKMKLSYIKRKTSGMLIKDMALRDLNTMFRSCVKNPEERKRLRREQYLRRRNERARAKYQSKVPE